MQTARLSVVGVPDGPELVRAAGGLVVRRPPRGGPEVVLVHRPARTDWTFPKGKVDPGETLDQTALREVREETGLVCSLGAFLGHTEYRDRKDRPKIVAYWVMTPRRGRFRPNDEVDELRWLGLEAAAELLSYDRDRELLAVFRADLDLATA